MSLSSLTPPRPVESLAAINFSLATATAGSAATQIGGAGMPAAGGGAGRSDRERRGPEPSPAVPASAAAGKAPSGHHHHDHARSALERLLEEVKALASEVLKPALSARRITEDRYKELKAAVYAHMKVLLRGAGAEDASGGGSGSSSSSRALSAAHRQAVRDFLTSRLG